MPIHGLVMTYVTPYPFRSERLHPSSPRVRVNVAVDSKVKTVLRLSSFGAAVGAAVVGPGERAP